MVPNEDEKDTSQDAVSAFKRAQRRHRRRGNDPNRNDDLVEFLDFSVQPTNHERIYQLTIPHNEMEDLYQGALYGLHGFDGFVFCPQALSSNLQEVLAFQSVSNFCEPPHVTNIDLVPPTSREVVRDGSSSMWEQWKHDEYIPQPPNHSNTARLHYRRFQKLSWATMGYNYDWTARAYRDECRSPMPPLLANIATIFAKTAMKAVDELERDNSAKPAPTKSFTPSACIVNYYNVKSIMGGHRDDLEYALDKPVVSLSMGLPGIFLLGRSTKDDAPVLPILVRPGDVLMLGGSCRLAYHGMARVLPSAVRIPASLAAENTKQGLLENAVNHTDDYTLVDEAERRYLAEFLQRHRININVRQVLPDEVSSISELTDEARARCLQMKVASGGDKP